MTRKVMHIGHDTCTEYHITDGYGNSNVVEQITEEKVLGVYITAYLKPSTQCVRAAAKARSVMGMVRRNFRRLDKEDFFLISKRTSGLIWSTVSRHGHRT